LPNHKKIISDKVYSSRGDNRLRVCFFKAHITGTTDEKDETNLYIFPVMLRMLKQDPFLKTNPFHLCLSVVESIVPLLILNQI